MSRSSTPFTRSPLAVAIAWACVLPSAGTAIADTEAPGSPMLLPEVTVAASAETGEGADPLITQSRVAAAGKSPVSVQDTPFAMNIIDVAQIRETGAKNIQDALLYSAGVYAGRYGFDTRGDWAAVRGLNPSNYTDGLRSLFGSYNTVRPEINALESIEVLKGPSSVLYGQAELGGIINVVTKKPKQTASREIEVQVGSHERKQIALDLTGPLNADKTLLYRLVTLKRDSDSQVDYVNDDAELFMPSLTWRPTARTSVTAQYTYQANDSKVSSQFLPSKGTIDRAPRGSIPSSRFVGEPGWDRYDTRKQEFSLFMDHLLTANWKLAASARQTRSDSVTREIWARVGQVPDDAGNIGRTVHAADRETDVLATDVRLEGTLALGPTRHHVALGVDHQHAGWDEDNYASVNPTFAANGVEDFNLYDPVYGSAGMRSFLASLTLTDRPDNKIVQTGVYAMDHMEWGPWVLSLAARHDRARNEVDNLGSAADSRVVNSETTGRTGLMYRFANGLSPYVSWSTAFTPNLGTDGTANPGFLKPTTGEQHEAGIKYLSRSGNTSAAAAWFDIKQQNRVVDGKTPGGREQVGATIRGWEVEGRHRLGALELLANLTDMTALNDVTGKRLGAIAERTASTWGQYHFAGGWRAGAGVRYLGDVTGNNGVPEVPEVTLYDAMVGYGRGPWDVRLDAKNLADTQYVSWCRGLNQDCGYGERFNANLTARYRF